MPHLVVPRRVVCVCGSHGAAALPLSERASRFLFKWRPVWRVVWRGRNNKVLSPSLRCPMVSWRDKRVRLPGAAALSLSGHASMFLFVWRVVWGAVWERRYNKVLSPSFRVRLQGAAALSGPEVVTLTQDRRVEGALLNCQLFKLSHVNCLQLSNVSCQVSEHDRNPTAEFRHRHLRSRAMPGGVRGG
jgi:hypothetical protein